jgi:hypothetical protein
MSKLPPKPAPLLNPWIALVTQDGSTHIVGCRCDKLQAVLPSFKRGFAEIRRWIVTPRVYMTDSASTIVGTADGVYRLGLNQMDSVPDRIMSSLWFDLAVLGLADDEMPPAMIAAALAGAEAERSV